MYIYPASFLQKPRPSRTILLCLRILTRSSFKLHLDILISNLAKVDLDIFSNCNLQPIMLSSAPSRVCRRHYGQNSHLLKRVEVRNARILLHHGSPSPSWSYLSVRRIHGENTSASHHDRTENIRNIGIIAHVDAVCCFWQLDRPSV